jgi:hypothetical protein
MLTSVSPKFGATFALGVEEKWYRFDRSEHGKVVAREVSREDVQAAFKDASDKVFLRVTGQGVFLKNHPADYDGHPVVLTDEEAVRYNAAPAGERRAMLNELLVGMHDFYYVQIEEHQFKTFA